MVGNLQLHSTDEFIKNQGQTQEYVPDESDSVPLLERLSSSLMRLALLGPVIILIGFFVWAMVPKMIEGKVVQYIIMAIGPVLFGAAIVGWLATHLQRVEWGREAYYKGVLSSVLALMLPPIWLVGIPTGLVSLWVLNQKTVINYFRRKGSGNAILLPVPKYLLDIGTLAGVMLTSFLALRVCGGVHFSTNDVFKATSLMLGLVFLVLPFRGELFRGRFLRDIAICISGFLMTAFAYWVFHSRSAPSEIELAVVCLIAFVLFAIPAIVIWMLLVRSKSEAVPPVQVSLSKGPTEGQRHKLSLGNRLLIGFAVGVAVIGLQLLVPTLQQKMLPPARLVIHHPGELKPVEIQIDGIRVSPKKQSGIHTLIDLKPGLHKVRISMQAGSEDPIHVENYKIHIRPGGNHEIPLRLPVKMDAGMDLGPVSKEYGGLILKITDTDMRVILLYHHSTDVGFRHNVFLAGEHQVPAGKYQAIAIDTLAGWLLDVKSDARNKQSYDRVYDAINRIYPKGDSEFDFFDKRSGTWAIVQYGISNIEIKPGEFETVIARRDLEAIALHHENFVDGKFYRFLWNRKKYSLSATQARVINELLQAYSKEKLALDESVVLEAVRQGDKEPEDSIRTIFNDGKHPAWGELLNQNETGGDVRISLTNLQNSSRPH